MATTQTETFAVDLASSAGFSDTIGLGCASLPAAVTCHFSSPSVSLASSSTQTAQLTIDTNDPLSGGASAMNSRSGNRSALLAGLFLPLSVFFGCLFARFRNRHWRGLTTMLLLCLAGAAMLVAGCSGISQASAKPGTYVIQVTGTGVKSNIMQGQNVTLNITK
jgi:hypothetical protein